MAPDAPPSDPPVDPLDESLAAALEDYHRRTALGLPASPADYAEALGARHAELLAIVALAAKTNHLANGLQVPLDAVFDVGHPR